MRRNLGRLSDVSPYETVFHTQQATVHRQTT